MLFSGVNEIKAKITYYAVYNFGPRWGLGYAVMRMFGAVAKQKLAAELARRELRLRRAESCRYSKNLDRQGQVPALVFLCGSKIGARPN